MESPPQGPRAFVIDNSNPDGLITMPDAAYKSSLPQILGTAWDASVDGPVPSPQTAPLAGSLKTVYFRLRRAEDGQYWVAASSSFAPSAVDCLTGTDATCMTPNVGSLPAQTYGVTHSSFQDPTAFQAGQAYAAVIVVKDRAGNGMTASQPFTWDLISPVSGSTLPASASRINNLPALAGTSSDNYSLQATSISLRSIQADACFDPAGGSFNKTCPFWFQTTSDGSGNWSWGDAGALALALANGQYYTLLSRAMDTAGNVQSSFVAGVSSRTFRFDSNPPTASITFPAHNGSYKSSQVGGAAYPLSGAAADPEAPSGIRKVELRVSYMQAADTWYWQPSQVQFSSGAGVSNGGYFTATDNSWRSIENVVWGAGDRQYRLEVRAEDDSYTGTGAALGNISFPSTAGTDIRDFIIDDTPATVALTHPAVDYLVSVTSFTGTASADLSGLDKVDIRLARVAGGPAGEWTGSSWTATAGHYSTATLSGVNGTVNWTYDDLAGALVDGERYTLYLRVTDLSGNVRNAPGGGDYTFTVDDAPPQATIARPAGPGAPPSYSNNAESTRQITVASGTVSDPGALASGVASVWVAISSGAAEDLWFNDATRSFDVMQANIFWSSQVYVTGQSSWIYAPPEFATAFSDGVLYRLHVKAKDNTGNWVNNVTTPGSSVRFQTFRYDVARPTSAVTAPANGASLKTLGALAGTSTDPGSGAAGIRAVYAAVRHTDGPSGLPAWWNWDIADFDAGISDPPPPPPGSAWAPVATTSVQGLSPVAWSTPVPAGMLVSSNTYRAVTAAFDWASNAQQNPAAAGAGSAFRFDNQAPVAQATAPVAGASLKQSTLGTLAGTASDATTGNSGVQTVQILLKMRAANAFWNGNTFGTFAQDWTVGTAGHANWATMSNPLETWSKLLPPMSPAESRELRLWARAADKAGNATDFPDDGEIDANLEADGVTPARLFTYDNTPPASLSTSPAAYVSFTPNALAGTAADAYEGVLEPSLVNEVRLKLRRSNGAGGDYWNFVANAWGADPGWSSVSGGLSQWSKAVLPSAFSDGYQYSINPWSRDASLNDEVDHSTYSFVVDRTTPTSKVGFPPDGGFLGLVTSIVGTAEDRYCALNAPYSCPGGGGMNFEGGVAGSSVAVALMRKIDEAYWDGGAFGPTAPVWSTAAFAGDSSGTWTYALPVNALVDSSSYTVSCRVLHDRAGNIQVEVTTNAFTVDSQNPVSLATAPAGIVNLMSPLSGTARDPPIGVLDVVLLKISQVTGPLSPAVWNGSGWTSGNDDLWIGTGTIGSLVTGTTYAWVFNDPGMVWRIKSNYEIKTRARDKAGHLGAIPAGPELTFTISGPQSGITTPANGEPHFHHLNLGIIAGTAVNAVTAAVRIVDAGPDLVLGAGDDDLVWTGSGWAPLNPLPASCATTQCYSGVTTYNSGALPNTWSSEFPTANWTPGRRYRVETKAINGPDTEIDFTGEETRTFVIDDTPPLSGVTVPSLAYYRLGQLATLSGTVEDTAPGSVVNSSVKFKILRLKDGWEWDVNTATFAASGSELMADFMGGNVFEFTNGQLTSEAVWEDGLLYQARLIAQDRAGNPGTVNAPAGGFRYDVSYPTATVSVPKSNVVINRLAGIAGTMADLDPDGSPNSNYDPSGVVQVKVYIQSQQNGGYFNGAGFLSGSAYPLPATLHETSWTYTSANLDATLIDGRYTIYAVAVDRAGNTQYNFSASGSSFTFLVDKTVPSIALTQPTQPAYTPAGIAAAGIQGTASDPLVSGTSSGLLLDGIEAQLWYVVGVSSTYWTGSAWVTGGASTLAANGAGWTLLSAPPASGPNSWASAGDRPFYIRARAHDRTVREDGNVLASTGNLSGWYGASPVLPDQPVSFIVDNTLPTVSLTAPASGALNSLPAITGAANGDIAGLGSVGVRLRRTGGGADQEWTGSAGGWVANDGTHFNAASFPGAYGAQNWTYSDLAGALSPDQQYTIYLRVTDQAGNVRQPPGGGDWAFLYDTQAPSLSISTPTPPSPTPFYSNDALSVRPSTYTWGLVSDGGSLPSGVTEVWIAVSSGSVGDKWWTETPAPAFSVDSPNIAWAKQVYVSGPNWQYVPANWSTELSDGVSYKIFVKARDAAGNWVNDVVTPGTSAAGQTQPFRYDLTRPTATVTSPVNGSAFNSDSFGGFFGNAGDPGTGVSGVKIVYLAVEHAAGPNGQIGFWNWGSGAFDDTITGQPDTDPATLSPAWVKVATAAAGNPSVNWWMAVPSGMFNSSNTYRAIVAVADWASNRPTNGEAGNPGMGSYFRVDPGPAHHLHFQDVPAEAAAGAPFSVRLSAHDRYHNLLSTGPNVYTSSVLLSAEMFAPPQDPQIAPGPVTFLESDEGSKLLANAFTLRKAGARWIKGTQLDNPLITTEVAGYSVQPLIAVANGPAASMTATPAPDLGPVQVRAGSLVAPGLQTITGQVRDPFNNPVAAAATAYLEVVDVTGSMGALAVNSGSGWETVGQSTVIVTDAQGRVGLDPLIGYLVSSHAGDAARVWVGTMSAPADLTPHIAMARNISAPLATIGGAPSALALVSIDAAAPASSMPGSGAAFTVQRRDDFGNPTDFGGTTVNLSLPGAQIQAHVDAGFSPGTPSSATGDFGFTEAGEPYSYVASISIADGLDSVSFRYRDKMSSYSGAHPAANTGIGGRPGRWTLRLIPQAPAIASATAELRLDPGPAVKFSFGNPPRALLAGRPSGFTGWPQPLNARLLDAFDNPVVAAAEVRVDLSTVTRNPSAFLDAVSFSTSPEIVAATALQPPFFLLPVSSMTIAPLAYEATFYYLDTGAAAPAPVVGISDADGVLISTRQPVAIYPDFIRKIGAPRIEPPALPRGATSQAITFELQDYFGNPSPVLEGMQDPPAFTDIQFALTSDSPGTRFSSPDPGAFTAAPGIARIAVDRSSGTFYMIDPSVLSLPHTVTVTEQLPRGWLAGSAAYTVVMSDDWFPRVSLLVPEPGSIAAAVSIISGTAAAGPASDSKEVAWVEVRVRRPSDGRYWGFSGSTWSEEAVSAVAAGTATWSVALGPAFGDSLESGNDYVVEARAADEGAPPNGGSFSASLSTFTFVDSLPPSAVASLAAAPFGGPGEVRLDWESSGDDGALGTLKAGSLFVIQRATFPTASWSPAEAQVSRSTSGVAAGQPQSLVLTGLPGGTTLYFRLWTRDDSGNVSAASNLAQAYIPPGATRLIAVAPGEAFTSGDGTLGRAAAYHIHVSTVGPLTASNFFGKAGMNADDAQALSRASVADLARGGFTARVPAPAASGSAEQLEVYDLKPRLAYHFAVRAIDDAGNLAAAFNSAPAAILAPVIFGDGGGSGRWSPALVPACSMLTATFTFSAGTHSFLTGGLVAVEVPAGWTLPQLQCSTCAGFARVTSTSSATLEPVLLPELGPRWAGFRTASGQLGPGQDALLAFQGVLTQAAPQSGLETRASSRASWSGRLKPLGTTPRADVVAGAAKVARWQAAGLRLGPSQASPALQLAGTDACGNLSAPAAPRTLTVSGRLPDLSADPGAQFSASPDLSGPASSLSVVLTSTFTPAFYYWNPLGGTRTLSVDYVDMSGTGESRRALLSAFVTGTAIGFLPGSLSVSTAGVTPGQTAATVTPDGDGVADRVQVSFTPTTADFEWQVTLSSRADFSAAARSFNGKGTPGGTVSWDGKDASGRVRPGLYYVRVQAADGVAVDWATLRVTVSAAGLSGLVTLAEAPAPAARVRISGAGVDLVERADAQGAYSAYGLRSGSTYSVTVEYQDPGSGRVATLETALLAPAASPQADLALARPPRLRVAATIPEPAPSELWGDVDVQDLFSARAVVARLRVQAGAMASDDGSVAASSWTVLDVEPGTYAVRLAFPGYFTAVSTLSLAAGTTDLARAFLRKPNLHGLVTLPELQTKGTVVSIVASPADSGGAPSVTSVYLPGTADTGRTPRLSAVYSIVGVDPGSYTITAQAPGFSSKTVGPILVDASDWGRPDTGGLDFPVLSYGGQLAGTMIVAGDTRSRGGVTAPLVARQRGGTGRAVAEVAVPAAASLASATYRLTGLADGDYELLSSVDGFESLVTTGPPQTPVVTVAGGSGNLDVVLAKSTGTVRAFFLLPPPSADYGQVSISLEGPGLSLWAPDATAAAGSFAAFASSAAWTSPAALGTRQCRLRALYKTTGAVKDLTVQAVSGQTRSVEVDLRGATQRVEGRITLESAVTLPAGAVTVTANAIGDLAPHAALSTFCSPNHDGCISTTSLRVELYPFETGADGVPGAGYGHGYAAAIATDGSFVFPAVPPGTYLLADHPDLDGNAANGDELAPFSQTIQVGASTVVADLSWTSGRQVRGRLMAPRSGGGGQLTVALVDRGGVARGTQAVTLSGDTVAYALSHAAAGSYLVVARDAVDPAVLVAAPVSVEVGASDAGAPDIQLYLGGAIQGTLNLKTVTLTETMITPLTQANRDLLPAGFEATAIADPWIPGGAGAAQRDAGGLIALDSYGRFRIPDLRPGTYRVQLAQTGAGVDTAGRGTLNLAPVVIAEVVVREGQTTDLGAVELKPAASVSGTARSASGAGLPNVRVVAEAVGGGSRIETLTGADGRFTISGLDPATRYYDLTAAPRESSRIDATNEPVPYAESLLAGVDVLTRFDGLDFSLEAADADLDCRVSAADGGTLLQPDPGYSGERGARLYLQRVAFWPRRGTLGDYVGYTDASGALLVRRLPASEYQVVAQASGYQAKMLFVTLRSGAVTSCSTSLSAGGTLRGDLTTPNGLPSESDVAEILARAVDGDSPDLLATLEVPGKSKSATKYSITGLGLGVTYRILVHDAAGNLYTPPEGEAIVFQQAEERELHLMIKKEAPSATGSAERGNSGGSNGSGGRSVQEAGSQASRMFHVGFDLTRPLRRVSPSDDDPRGMIRVSTGLVRSAAIRPDRRRVSFELDAALTDVSSITVQFSAFSNANDLEALRPDTTYLVLRATTVVYLGVDAVKENPIGAATGGKVGVGGTDPSNVVLPAGALQVDVSSVVVVGMQSARGAAPSKATPAGASPRTAYGASAYPAALYRALAAAPASARALSAFYDIFLPLGVRTQLRRPAELTVSYDASVDPARLNLYWYNEAAGIYVLQQDALGGAPQIDRVNHTIKVRVNHFSTFVLFDSKSIVVTDQGNFVGGDIEAFAYPNPFDLTPKPVDLTKGGGAAQTVRGTMIRVGLPAGSPGEVKIRIYNVAGERVRSISFPVRSGGAYHYVEWDGRNDSGRDVASGLYLGVAESGSKARTFKMAVLR